MVGLEGQMRAEGPVGRYRTVLPLGQGGTADVHLAIADGPAGFRKLVVLKVLRSALSQDPELRAMFLSEARLAARLHHTNVVQTYEVIDQGSAPVIVMEYLDGQPLSHLIVRGRGVGLTLALQLRILIDALAGLHAAHELRDFDGTPLGVVHRDVSPHNLFVTAEGQVKVLDFGIAKLDRSLVETEVGTIKGKIRYMAPEQLRAEALDRRADVYSAGVILWEALVGERMWKGVADAEIRSRVSAGDLPHPRSLRPDVPVALDRICRGALAHDPRGRPATALALADELEAALAALPGGAPSHRDLGALVTRLFEDMRRETRVAIEEHMGRMEVEATRTTGELSPVELLAAPADRDSARRASGQRRTKVRRAALAITSLGLAAGALYAAARFSSAYAPRVTPLAAPAEAPPGSAHPPEPALARSPGSAGPASSIAAAASVEDREARARAGKPAGKRPLRTTTAAEPPRDPPPDCAHPFFIDKDGIKKFRAECM